MCRKSPMMTCKVFAFQLALMQMIDLSQVLEHLAF
jgi:hypothetical protein